MIACDLPVFIFSLLAFIQCLTCKSSLLHKASNSFRLSEEYNLTIVYHLQTNVVCKVMHC